MMQNIHAPGVAKSYAGQAHRGFAQISSKILFYSILILSSQRSMASEAVGEVVAAASVDYAATAGGIFSCVGAGVQVYSAGKDMKSYFCPNKEEQSRISNASEQLELATSRSKFKNCLITNKSSSEVDASGCPMKCEAAALMLEMCGKENEVIDIIKIFNNMKKGKS